MDSNGRAPYGCLAELMRYDRRMKGSTAGKLVSRSSSLSQLSLLIYATKVSYDGIDAFD